MTALKIGFFQCIAMIPGTSRSGASIVGGDEPKIKAYRSRRILFFPCRAPPCSVPRSKNPTIIIKAGFVLNGEQINLLIIGNVVGFLVALVAIKTFIDYLGKHGFKVFGYYRIYCRPCDPDHPFLYPAAGDRLIFETGDNR